MIDSTFVRAHQHASGAGTLSARPRLQGARVVTGQAGIPRRVACPPCTTNRSSCFVGQSLFRTVNLAFSANSLVNPSRMRLTFAAMM